MSGAESGHLTAINYSMSQITLEIPTPLYPVPPIEQAIDSTGLNYVSQHYTRSLVEYVVSVTSGLAASDKPG